MITNQNQILSQFKTKAEDIIKQYAANHLELRALLEEAAKSSLTTDDKIQLASSIADKIILKLQSEGSSNLKLFNDFITIITPQGICFFKTLDQRINFFNETITKAAKQQNIDPIKILETSIDTMMKASTKIESKQKVLIGFMRNLNSLKSKDKYYKQDMIKIIINKACNMQEEENYNDAEKSESEKKATIS